MRRTLYGITNNSTEKYKCSLLDKKLSLKFHISSGTAGPYVLTIYIVFLQCRAAMIHFPMIRYISQYKGHDTIHDTIHYSARQN